MKADQDLVIAINRSNPKTYRHEKTIITIVLSDFGRECSGCNREEGWDSHSYEGAGGEH